MAKAKGIQSHKVFKLGKAGAKRDRRNLMFAAILRAPVKVPPEYDFDLKHPGIPTPMFANDTWGDCVIAGRAHQTLRFELIEQGSKIGIADADVLREYLKETGGADSGLVVLDSLNEWRHDGWAVGKGAKRRTYRIKAWSELNRGNHPQIRTAIYLDIGVGLGLSLPRSAQPQVQAGKPWDVVSGPSGKPGSWGGHYVYVPGYTRLGPVCVTWGRKQQMTWRFFDRYCDEAYAIFDALDTARLKRALNVPEVTSFLKAL